MGDHIKHEEKMERVQQVMIEVLNKHFPINYNI